MNNKIILLFARGLGRSETSQFAKFEPSIGLTGQHYAVPETWFLRPATPPADNPSRGGQRRWKGSLDVSEWDTLICHEPHRVVPRGPVELISK